jgi:hypothetical protein
MRRKRLLPNAGAIHRLPRRQHKPDLPEVPTVQPTRSANPPPPNPETNDDPTEDAVRRMIEAAYT